MSLALLLSGLVMGLATGPHCVVMCGPVCAGMRQGCPRSGAGGGGRSVVSAWQLGRVIGYSAAGAVVAGSVQSLGWVSQLAPWIKPVWVLLHAAMLVWGLSIVVMARTPAVGWRIAAHWNAVWQRQGRSLPWLGLGIGAGWAVMPCGLLYSALMMAALSGSAPAGAGFMALFAVGSGLVLCLSSTVWRRLQAGAAAAWQPLLTRASGLLLTVAAGWALIASARGTVAPWCS